jgi:hypothetical protein
MNMDNTFKNEQTIPPGGTAYYTIPLVSVLNGLNPNTFASDVIINIYEIKPSSKWYRNLISY